MSEPTITPALTLEEWAHPRREVVRGPLEEGKRIYLQLPSSDAAAPAGWLRGVLRINWYERANGHNVPPESRHALAALALHGQPFGFTRDDVTLCRDAAAYFRRVDARDGADAQWFDGLAARIAALLPPEGT